MSPSRASSLFVPVLIVLGVLFVISNLYNYFANDDEYDDEDTITVTFNCTQVLGSQNNYPEFVVQQCKQMRANE
jgi:hypothetical protein